MNQGGEASEQVVRIMIEGTEVALRLTGSATKNVAAALYAFYKDNNSSKGKTTLTRILKEGKETRIFRMETKDLAEFKKQAKKYGIMYVAIKDKKATDELCDVIIKSEDVAKVNHVLGKMNYITMNQEQPSQDKDNAPSKKDNQQRNNLDTQNLNSMQRNKPKIDIEQVVKDFQSGNKEAVTPDHWKAYLNLQSQLYQYSPKNKERILTQFPSASVVMSRSKWREMGRYPKQDAKGLFITMPEYKDGNRTGQFIDTKVYDISETYGKSINKTHALQLTNNSQAIKSEIERMKSTSLVPVHYVKTLETDSYYDDKTKTILIRNDLCETDQFKGLCLEQVYANAHLEKGDNYLRGNHRLQAESVAYMMASKYGIDTNEYTFDYIPDEVNGLDGKDLKELIKPIIAKGSKEISKADKNLEKYKVKEKPSVKQDLQQHKKAIETKTFHAAPEKVQSKVR